MSETCPTCGGEKVVRGYACPGFKLVTLTCWDCKGVGVLDDVRLVWKRDGETLRKFQEPPFVPQGWIKGLATREEPPTPDWDF